jgi:hypothetical protein
MQDCVAKKRFANLAGSKNNYAKLDEQKVLTIKQRIKDGDISALIAKDFEVHKSTIEYIKIGRSWKHVK